MKKIRKKQKRGRPIGYVAVKDSTPLSSRKGATCGDRNAIPESAKFHFQLKDSLAGCLDPELANGDSTQSLMRSAQEIADERERTYKRLWFIQAQIFKDCSPESLIGLPPEFLEQFRAQVEIVREILDKSVLEKEYSEFEMGLLYGRLETLRWVSRCTWGCFDL